MTALETERDVKRTHETRRQWETFSAESSYTLITGNWFIGYKQSGSFFRVLYKEDGSARRHKDPVRSVRRFPSYYWHNNWSSTTRERYASGDGGYCCRIGAGTEGCCLLSERSLHSGTSIVEIKGLGGMKVKGFLDFVPVVVNK